MFVKLACHPSNHNMCVSLTCVTYLRILNGKQDTGELLLHFSNDVLLPNDFGRYYDYTERALA